MKNILVIANYKGSIGGISGQVEQLQNCLMNEGVSELGNERYRADIFSTQGNVVRRVLKFIELIWEARKYDVLHLHGCSERGMLPIVYGVIAGKIWRKRIIVTYHGGGAEEYFSKHGAFARRWLKRADKVIVLNGYLDKVFAKYNIPCIVIPNFVDLPKIEHIEAIDAKTVRFISVRHLDELYNVGSIIRAYEKAKKKLDGASLTILGDGPQREELEQMVKRKVESGEWKEDDVRFVGQVSNKEIYTYLANSDIMLSAPRIDNMPVSVLEAMNAGVLVISSRVGGVPYIIEEDKTGLLFEYNNADELAQKMIWAAEHRQEVKEMTDAAKEEVKKYSWQNIRTVLLPLYEG